MNLLNPFPRRRRRFSAGAERCSRISQACLNSPGGRVRAAEHAPRDAFYFLERRHGLAEIIQRTAKRVLLAHLRVLARDPRLRIRVA